MPPYAGPALHRPMLDLPYAGKLPYTDNLPTLTTYPTLSSLSVCELPLAATPSAPSLNLQVHERFLFRMVPHMDEHKSVDKEAQIDQPPPPVSHTKMQDNIPASIQRSYKEMDLEVEPIGDPESSPPSSPPDSPPQVQRSHHIQSQSPAPSSMLHQTPITLDIANIQRLDSIEEDVEMLSRSSVLDLLVDSQAESNRESHVYPLTLFLHTFPQLLRLFRMTKVFYPNHPFHHPLILLIKSNQKHCLKLTLSGTARV